MSAYFFCTIDGADLDNKTVKLNAGAVTASLSAVTGTPYGNSLTNVGIDEIRTLLKTALDAATASTWTVNIVRQNQYRWAITLAHDDAVPWDIENTGTFDLSLIGLNPADCPVTVPVGTTVTLGWQPWGVWFWSYGQVWRRRPAYLSTTATLATSGRAATRRASKYHIWQFWFNPVRGGHVFLSDLAVMASYMGCEADDPNLPFEAAVWDQLQDEVYFVPSLTDSAVYQVRVVDEKFLGDILEKADDRSNPVLARLNLTFEAWEKSA